MDAKLQLSAEEMRLVTDPAWILTKNSVVRKAVEMFAGLAGEWRGMLDRGLVGPEAGERREMKDRGMVGPEAGERREMKDRGMVGPEAGERREMKDRGMVGPEAGMVAVSEPKISRGEQYKGLPWVMLDYPRVFGKEDIMAIRTMFWWGHCFSVTLHLKGKYLRAYLPVILANRVLLETAGFEPGIADDEWEHEHAPGEWAMLGDRAFAKISATIGLDRWNAAPGMLTEKFAVLAGLLHSPARGDH